MHEIQALVAPQNVFDGFIERVSAAVVRSLPQGYALVPVSDMLLAALENSSAGEDCLSEQGPDTVCGLHTLAAELSLKGPVVYVETEFFGGVGGQEAIVWEQGRMTLKLQEGENSKSAWPDSSISQALRRAGVVARPGEDEFDAVGLGSHRSTEDWASSSEDVFPAPILPRWSPPDDIKPWWKFW